MEEFIKNSVGDSPKAREEFLRKEWSNILENMKKDFEISNLTYNTFLLPLKVYSVEGNTIIITSSEKEIGIDYVKKKYTSHLKYAISAALGKEIEVELIAVTNEEEEQAEADNGEAVKNKINSKAFNLNPKYTFDSFVVGDSNRLAHALSLAVAESPGQVYNPLFLYGRAGLGKTHLIQAIAHHILTKNPNLNVIYTTCDDYVDELIMLLRNKANLSEFKSKYINADVLLIDDIQSLIGKPSIQEEFFHAFNTLTTNNKAVIICSDRPPKELATLNERFISRFEMGGMADIQMPTYETKMAILSKKEQIENIKVPLEVKSFIASNINSSIRQLEGALTNLIFYSKISKADITVEFAEQALKDVISPNENKHVITPDRILSIVAEHYNISPEDIISQKRQAKIVNGRHIVMYLCRELTGMTLEGIGEFLGNRDHSTTDHAIKKIEAKISTEEGFASTINVIKNKIDS